MNQAFTNEKETEGLPDQHLSKPSREGTKNHCKQAYQQIMTPEIISSIDQLKKIAKAIVDAQVLANDYAELKAAPFVISEGIQDAKDSMRSLAAEYLFRHLQLTNAVAEWNKQAFPQQRMAERQAPINDKRFPCEHSIFLRTQITTVNS